MEKLFKALILIVMLFCMNGRIFSQEIFDKLSVDFCNCLETKKIKNLDKAAPCFEDTLLNNLTEIKKHYKAETIDGIDMDEVGSKIGAKITLNCKYLMDNFDTGAVGEDEKVERQANLSCSDIKEGDFYYLTPTMNPQVKDTTFVTISGNMFLERMKSGRTYSLLEIGWKNDCEFELIFKESNDPIKKEISKKGDVYRYDVIQNNSTSVFLNMNWSGKEYQFELIKMN